MIPKIIHYIWLGGNPLNEVAEKCIESWKKYCPDYEIKRWDESNLDLDIVPYVRQAYDAKKYAFASDVLRFDILNREGGIYLDVDVELIKNIDPLLEDHLFMGFEIEDFVNPGLIMGAEENNEHICNLLNLYSNVKFYLKNGRYNLTTVCERTTSYLIKLGLKQNCSDIQHFKGITIYPIEYFCPMNYKTREINKTINTFSIHWYAGSWVVKPKLFERIWLNFKKVIKKIIGKKNAEKIRNWRNKDE